MELTRILLIDDIPDTIEVYRLIFRMNAFRVECAYNGEEGLRIVQQNPQPFDAIIVDVEMPKHSGWDTVKAIRELPQGKSPFIVLFTAYNRTADTDAHVKEVGADCLLHKPIMPNELLQRITEGVETRQSRERND